MEGEKILNQGILLIQDWIDRVLPKMILREGGEELILEKRPVSESSDLVLLLFNWNNFEVNQG